MEKSFILQQRATGNETDPILGCLCWWTIRNQIIDHATLKEIVEAENLDQYLPKPIRPCGAFRRATRMVQKDLQPVDEAVSKDDESIFVREVDCSETHIFRKLVTEIRDKAAKELSYQQTADITFNKVTQDIDITGADAGTKNRILQNYELLNGRHNGERLRVLVKNIMDSTSPTLIRPSGSVYFIPACHRSKVEKLERIVQQINMKGTIKDQTLTFEHIGVLDSEKHREMVLKHFETQTVGQVNSFMAEATQVLKDNRWIKPGVAARFMESVQRSRQAVKTYEDMLEKDLFLCREKVAVAQQQALDILARVKDESDLVFTRENQVYSDAMPAAVNA